MRQLTCQKLYFEHAEQYASQLNLKLGVKKTSAGPVAMAGFPFFQLDRFLKTLVQDLNKHVAISEEFPVATSGRVKSGGLLFDRKVARVVTPGTLIDEKFIDPFENNFLLSVHPGVAQASLDRGSAQVSFHENRPADRLGQRLGLAWLDLSTGDFFTQVTTFALLPSALARIRPREIVLDPIWQASNQPLLQSIFDGGHVLTSTHHCMKEIATLSEWNHTLEAPIDPLSEAAFTSEETFAIHHLLDYVAGQLQGLEMKLQPPRRKVLQETMTIDRNSMRGLEILETARDGLGKGSLLHAIRRTTTKSGTRLLRDRLASPSASVHEIEGRLNLVGMFLDDSDLREVIVQLLQQSYDAQRLVQKFSLNKGDADDLIYLARAIESTKAIRVRLDRKLQQTNSAADSSSMAVSALLMRLDLHGPTQLGLRILEAIDEDGLNKKHRIEESEAASVAALAQEVAMSDALPEEIEAMPQKIRQGKKAAEAKDIDSEFEDTWIMRKTASDALTQLHEDLENLRLEKSSLTGELREKLQAATLTLKWTPGLGHICHVRGINKVPLESVNARVVSSTKSTRSFYLTSWSRLGSKVDQAKTYIRNEEKRIFLNLRSEVIRNLVKLRRNAAVLDELDFACSFANLADEQSWSRPVLNTGMDHRIIGGRHPTVKLGLEEQGRSFVSNNLLLGSEERVWLVTGPNMAGKSTFLRQNALISILAQVGSYVPAEYAEIGIVDQVFSRIGAADDLFRDQSTFMVEMLETAAILRQATPRSFVIMDEVGRGTTPEDGIAVGYACLHHLHHINKCRTLFATHFHALADMTRDFKYLGRYCTDLTEDEDGSFSFMHRLRQGVNRQSHALKVARLAGLPETAIEIANGVLRELMVENQVRVPAQYQDMRQKELQAAAG
jgi:DNA mismatch repair ATPase MutS